MQHRNQDDQIRLTHPAWTPSRRCHQRIASHPPDQFVHLERHADRGRAAGTPTRNRDPFRYWTVAPTASRRRRLATLSHCADASESLHHRVADVEAGEQSDTFQVHRAGSAQRSATAERMRSTEATAQGRREQGSVVCAVVAYGCGMGNRVPHRAVVPGRSEPTADQRSPLWVLPSVIPFLHRFKQHRVRTE